MGLKFKLKHVNVVAYMTATQEVPVPQLTKSQLIEPLRFLSGKEGQTPLLSASSDWIEEVAWIANHIYKRVEDLPYDENEYVPSSDIRDLLGELRKIFSNFL